MTDQTSSVQPPFDGGCACGNLRYRMLAQALFVHCCHCTRCQRETGGPFAHHAMIEMAQMTLLSGEPELVLVPTDSGRKHWVARCPACKTALWNVHGTKKAVICYLRVGTLDTPQHFPPLAHIYVRSKQPWLQLAVDPPCFQAYYDSAKIWPAASLARYVEAKARKKVKSGED